MGRLVIISGDDDFAVKARARETVAAHCGADFESDPGLEIIACDNAEMKFDAVVSRLLGAMRTPPFLADHQLIWVRNFPDFEALSSAYKGKDAAAEAAQMLLDPLPEEQTVVINGPGFDQRKAWPKAVKAAGAEVVILNSAKSSDKNFAENRKLEIREFCRANGKSIDPRAVQYLEEIVGADSGTLHQELEKLFTYAGDAPELTLDDCRTVCSRTPEAVSWDFTGALVDRDVRRALALLDLLIKQGDAELKVLAAVTGEFQGLIRVKLAMKQLGVTRVNPRTFDGISDAVKTANPGNMLLKLHPYRAFKMCESAVRFDDAELAGCLQAVLDANRALVSGGGEPRIVLEQLIFRITKKEKK